MKQLFLTSSAHTTADDIASRVDLSKGNRLVFIDTAAEPELVPEKIGDRTWLTNDHDALVDAGFDVQRYTITGRMPKEVADFITPFDFIYCSGGDTVHLLKEAYRCDFITLVHDLILNQDKIYIGTSAGSIIAGPRIPIYLFEDQNDELVARPAFNLVNLTIVPHWGDEFFRDRYLNTCLKQVYREDEAPFVLLSNSQYIHVRGDWYSIIDVGV